MNGSIFEIMNLGGRRAILRDGDGGGGGGDSGGGSGGIASASDTSGPDDNARADDKAPIVTSNGASGAFLQDSTPEVEVFLTWRTLLAIAAAIGAGYLLYNAAVV